MKTTKRYMALFLAISMTLSMVSINSLADLLETNGEGGLPPEGGTPLSPETFTVKFFLDGELIDTKTVFEDSPCPEPVVPEYPEGTTTFLGWFHTEDDDVNLNEYFDFDTTITYDLNLYAHFTSSYLVHFKDTTGTVIKTELVENGGYASEPDDLVINSESGKIYQGTWTLEDEEEVYDFGTPVTENIVLVPLLDNLHLISFVTKGTLIASQLIANGASVEKPSDPERSGYDFVGWSLDPNSTADEYDFDSKVYEGAKIYAIWSPKLVKYQVVFWLEKENQPVDTTYDELEYEQAYAAQFEAMAGSQISYGCQITTKDPKAPYDETSHYIKTDDGVTNPLGSDFSVALLQVNPATGAYTNGAPFANSVASDTNVTVAGDGSTLFNVYFARTVYNLKYVITDIGAGSTLTVSEDMAELMGLYDSEGNLKTEFTSADNGKYSYTLPAKIGQDTTYTFPACFAEDGTQSFIYSVSSMEMRGWGPYSVQGMTHLSASHLMTSGTWANSYSNVTKTAGIHSRFNKNTVKSVLKYFVESLDQDAATAETAPVYTTPDDASTLDTVARYKIDELWYSYEGTNVKTIKYNLHKIPEGSNIFDLHETSRPFFAVLNDRQITSGIPGFTPYTAAPTMSSTYHHCYQWNEAAETSKNAGDKVDVFYQLYDNNSNSNHANRYFFYSRNSYNIEVNYITNFQKGTETWKKTVSEPIKYEANIYNSLEAATAEMREAMPESGVVFDGWYMDSAYTKPYNYDENTTMPCTSASSGVSLILYAKYTYADHTATFLGSKGGEEVETQVFESGDTIDAPSIWETGKGYPGLGVFVGWYYTVENASNKGVDLPFDFDTAPTDDITLFAVWNVSGFKVTYDLNGGTGTLPKDAKSYKVDNLVYVLGTNAKKDGMVFAGWTSSYDDDTRIYYPGSTITIYQNIKLTARYIPSDSAVTLTFHQNTNTSDEVTKIWYLEAGQEVALPSERSLCFSHNLSRYVFIGWAESPDAEEADYPAGAQFTVDTDTDLYAVWSAKHYIVTYFRNRSATDETSYTEAVLKNTDWTHLSLDDSRLVSQSFYRSGYSFVGWALTANATAPNVLPGDVETVTQDIELYAIWEITDDGSGDTPYPPPPTKEDPKPEEPTPPVPPEGEKEETPKPLIDEDSGHTVERQEDGSYIEFTDEGVPLGTWVWDEEIEEWIFEESVPLSDIPQTGDSGLMLYAATALVSMLACLYVIFYDKKKLLN